MAIPVSIEDARRQVRLDEDDTSLDADLVGFIADAAAWVERYTGHLLVARDVTEHFKTFDRVALRAWPIKADAVVTVSYDVLGSPVEVPGARLSLGQRPATLLPAGGTRFICGPADVQVTVRAGYEEGGLVPREMRRAMLILISAYEFDREGGDIFAKAEASARRLCGDYRLHKL